MALYRNWAVTAVVGALTLLLAASAATAQPSYQTRSVITLLSPEAPFPRNAYASFTPSLVLMGDVLARTMQTAAARRSVGHAGGRADFQVELFNRGSEQYPIYDQPYLTVTTSSPVPAEAERTQRAVIAVLSVELRRRQIRTGSHAGSYISWRVTDSNSTAVLVTGQPSRQLLAILVLGFVVAVYLSLVADRHGDRLRALRGAVRQRVTGAPPRVPTAGAGSR